MQVEASAPSSCDDLWYQRNFYYKAAGYCFRTSRGVQAFGNAGCSYDNEADFLLSGRQRGEVAALRRSETAMGCPRLRSSTASSRRILSVRPPLANAHIRPRRSSRRPRRTTLS